MKRWAFYSPSGVIQFVSEMQDFVVPTAPDGFGGVIEIAAGVDVSAHHVAAGALVAGALDLRTLDERKAERWEQMKAARATAIGSPMTTPYGTFDCDPKSRANITDAVLMVQTLSSMAQPASITFTLADNTAVTLTAAQMVEVGLALGAKVQAAHATGRTLRAAIDAATTAEEVDAIAWPT